MTLIFTILALLAGLQLTLVIICVLGGYPVARDLPFQRATWFVFSALAASLVMLVALEVPATASNRDQVLAVARYISVGILTAELLALGFQLHRLVGVTTHLPWNLTPRERREEILRFLAEIADQNREPPRWRWFIRYRFEDPDLDALRRQCFLIDETHRVWHAGESEMLSPEGIVALRQVIEAFRPLLQDEAA